MIVIIINDCHVFGDKRGNVGFKIFFLKSSENFISGIHLCKDLSLEGVDLVLFGGDTECYISKSFEISIPVWGTEKVDVLALVGAGQEFEEIIN